MINVARNLLNNRNYVLYANILDGIDRGELDIILADEHLGVFCYHSLAEMYYLAPFSKDGAVRMNELLLKNGESGLFVLHGEEYVSVFKEGFSVYRETPCYQAVFPRRQDISLPEGVEIRLLGGSFTDLITEKYSRSHGNSEYIKQLLDSGVMYGAFIDDEIVGFIGQHDEHSIGLLEVFPAFSGRGVGSALESFMINKVLSEGFTPYCHVVEDNEVAFHFHMKRPGVMMSRDKVVWIYRSRE